MEKIIKRCLIVTLLIFSLSISMATQTSSIYTKTLNSMYGTITYNNPDQYSWYYNC